MAPTGLNVNAEEFIPINIEEIDNLLDDIGDIGELIRNFEDDDVPDHAPRLERHNANAGILEEDDELHIVNGLNIARLDLSFLDDIDNDPIAREPFVYPLEYLAPAVPDEEDFGPLDNLYFSPPAINRRVGRRNCPN